MKSLKIIIALIIVITVGCTERITLDIDPGYTRLAVEGSITTDTMQHLVRLSTSGDYLKNEITPRINDARVYLVCEQDTLDYIRLEEDGVYSTPGDYFGITGKTYELHVEEVDIDKDGIQESYTASSTMPFAHKIDSITLGYNVKIELWSVNIWAWEPPEINWYIFKAGINGQIMTDTLTEWNLQDDRLSNGKNTNGIFVQFLGRGDEKIEVNDTIILELRSVTDDYYQFTVNLQSEVFGSNPLFGGPPANVIGNVSDGALGFFSTEAISRASRVVKFIPTESTGGFGPP